LFHLAFMQVDARSEHAQKTTPATAKFKTKGNGKSTKSLFKNQVGICSTVCCGRASQL
jgi:hypothetical protein